MGGIMTTAVQAREGHVEVIGGRIWCRIVGDTDATPLVTVHGGPGATHDYLEPLQALADERPVVFYDQLGAGNSEVPDDISLWTNDRFVDELGGSWMPWGWSVSTCSANPGERSSSPSTPSPSRSVWPAWSCPTRA
jgi:hypothetical protein